MHLLPWDRDKKGHTDMINVQKREETESTKATFYLCGTEQALPQLLYSEHQMPSLEHLRIKSSRQGKECWKPSSALSRVSQKARSLELALYIGDIVVIFYSYFKACYFFSEISNVSIHKL